jgi:hypothetical protein
MGLVKIKSDGLYVRRYQALTDEYNLIFVGFKTEEYSLNIFMDIITYFL